MLADLRDYDRWLPGSSAFKGTHGISEGPFGVGTTYVEPGPLGVRHGQVTEFAPPTRLSFEQPMSLTPKAFGVIGIQLFHTLTQGAGSVRMHRELQLEPRGIVRWDDAPDRAGIPRRERADDEGAEGLRGKRSALISR